MYDIVIAGPAWFAAAVPVSTKMPVPMMAPMPSSVRSSALKRAPQVLLAVLDVADELLDRLRLQQMRVHSRLRRRRAPAPHATRRLARWRSRNYTRRSPPHAPQADRGTGACVLRDRPVANRSPITATLAAPAARTCGARSSVMPPIATIGTAPSSTVAANCTSSSPDGVIARVLRAAAEDRTNGEVGHRLGPGGGDLLTRVRGQAHDRRCAQEGAGGRRPADRPARRARRTRQPCARCPACRSR